MPKIVTFYTHDHHPGSRLIYSVSYGGQYGIEFSTINLTQSYHHDNEKMKMEKFPKHFSTK